MHSSGLAGCALLTLVATAGAQSPATSSSGPQNAALPTSSAIKTARCPAAVTTADNCVTADENTEHLPDLSPTQFLFGKDIGTKLSQQSQQSYTLKRLQVTAIRDDDIQQVHQVITPEYAALLRLLTVPTAPVNGVVQNRQLTPAEQLAVRAQAQRYLVEEWRQAQLEVAASVHHAVLLRIGATQDSASAAGMTGGARTDLLRKLTDQARANDYSWYIFRSEVNTQADAARLSPTASPQ
jgi:hypothetical protein